MKNSIKHEFIECPILPRKGKILYNKIPKTFFQIRRYKQGSEAHHPTVPEDYYYSIYFEALDLISVFIKTRFHQPSFKDFLNLESVFLQLVNRGGSGTVTTSKMECFAIIIYHGHIITENLKIIKI